MKDKPMGTKERDSIIEQLHLVTGYNRSVFTKLSDIELLKELAKYYE